MVKLCEDFLKWFGDNALPVIATFMLIGSAIVVPWIAYDCWRCSHLPPPATITLKADSWECTETHRVYYTTMTMVMAGKIMVPQSHSREECMVWEWKGEK